MLLYCYSKLHIKHASNTKCYAPFVDQGPLQHAAFSVYATSPVYLIFLQLFSPMEINVWNIFLTQQNCSMYGPNQKPSYELHRSKSFSRSYKMFSRWLYSPYILEPWIHYHIRKGPTLAPTLNKMNALHKILSFIIHFNIVLLLVTWYSKYSLSFKIPQLKIS
jgi:hypothetical protein